MQMVASFFLASVAVAVSEVNDSSLVLVQRRAAAKVASAMWSTDVSEVEHPKHETQQELVADGGGGCCEYEVGQAAKSVYSTHTQSGPYHNVTIPACKGARRMSLFTRSEGMHMPAGTYHDNLPCECANPSLEQVRLHRGPCGAELKEGQENPEDAPIVWVVAAAMEYEVEHPKHETRQELVADGGGGCCEYAVGQAAKSVHSAHKQSGPYHNVTIPACKGARRMSLFPRSEGMHLPAGTYHDNLPCECANPSLEKVRFHRGPCGAELKEGQEYPEDHAIVWVVAIAMPIIATVAWSNSSDWYW